MGFLEVITVLGGVFKFWDQVTWLIKQLQETPIEKHDKLVVKIGDESREFKRTGRPKWD